MKRILLIFFLCLGYGLLASPAFAHKVNIFAYAEGGRIYTESYFPDGRPVAGGKVLVFNAAGEELVAAKSDNDGRCDFAIPEVTDLRILIEASMGHRNSYMLKQAEVEAGR